MKTHFTVAPKGWHVPTKTYCGRIIDKVWVTKKLSDVNCLRCLNLIEADLNGYQ